MNKNLLIAFIMTIVFITILAAFSYFAIFNKQNDKPTLSPKVSAKPTPIEPQNGTGAEADQVNSSSNNKGYFLGELSLKLPYRGTNFSLSYNGDTDEFTLYLKPGNEAAGRSEFANYLKQNNIQSPNWIENLKTTTSPI